MTSTLSHFWQLASSSKPDRLGSAHALVQNLVREQSHLSTVNGKAAKRSQLLSDDGLMDLEAPEQVTDEDVQQAESSLNGSETADVAYAVKRLIKGLASHRESSRLGFSVALSEVGICGRRVCMPFMSDNIFATTAPLAPAYNIRPSRFGPRFGILDPQWEAQRSGGT